MHNFGAKGDSDQRPPNSQGSNLRSRYKSHPPAAVFLKTRRLVSLCIVSNKRFSRHKWSLQSTFVHSKLNKRDELSKGTPSFVSGMGGVLVGTGETLPSPHGSFIGRRGGVYSSSISIVTSTCWQPTHINRRTQTYETGVDT